jgi:hypothetical protein
MFLFVILFLEGLMRATKSKLLRRSDGSASKYLQDVWGIKRAPPTLTHDAMRGAGPAFTCISGRIFYTDKSLDAYARSQLNKPLSPHGRKINRTKGRKQTTVATDKKPEADAGGLS